MNLNQHENVGIPNFKVQNWAAKRFAQRGWRVGPGFWRNDPCHSSTRGVIWRFMTSWKRAGGCNLGYLNHSESRYYRYYLDNPRHSNFLCCSLSVSNQLMEYIFCKISLQARLWISFWALRFTTSNLSAGKTNAPTEFCKSSKLIQASMDKTARRPTKQPSKLASKCWQVLCQGYCFSKLSLPDQDLLELWIFVCLPASTPWRHLCEPLDHLWIKLQTEIASNIGNIKSTKSTRPTISSSETDCSCVCNFCSSCNTSKVLCCN